MPKNWEDASAREEEMLAQLHALGELSFDLPYTNIGKFPLKQIFLEGNVDVLGTDQPVTFDYQRNHWVNSENALFPGRTNAFPVADLVNELDAVTVTDDLRYELIDGKKYLAVYARGHFVDDFG